MNNKRERDLTTRLPAPSSDQEEDDDEDLIVTPTNQHDFSWADDEDLLIERDKKRVKQTRLIYSEKVSANYSKSYYKCLNRCNDEEYDVYLLFSENKTPTKEIKQTVFISDGGALVVLTVDNRLYYFYNIGTNEESSFKEIHIDDTIRSSIIKLVATTFSAYLLTKKSVFIIRESGGSSRKMSCNEIFPLFPSSTNLDEEFVDITSSFVDNLIMLTNQNRIVTTGWNRYGMLGDGTTKSKYNRLVFPKTTHTLPVKFLVSGAGFSVYSSGAIIYACGQLDNLIGASRSTTTFEEQTHFKFEVSDILKIISSPLFTFFWTKQHDLHIYGKEFYFKLNISPNIYAIEVQKNNIFYCYQNGAEVTITRKQHLGGREFSEEKEIGCADVNSFNSLIATNGLLLVYYQMPKVDSFFKKAIMVQFSDVNFHLS